MYLFSSFQYPTVGNVDAHKPQLPILKELFPGKGSLSQSFRCPHWVTLFYQSWIADLWSLQSKEKISIFLTSLLFLCSSATKQILAWVITIESCYFTSHLLAISDIKNISHVFRPSVSLMSIINSYILSMFCDYLSYTLVYKKVFVCLFVLCRPILFVFFFRVLSFDICIVFEWKIMSE